MTIACVNKVLIIKIIIKVLNSKRERRKMANSVEQCGRSYVGGLLICITNNRDIYPNTLTNNTSPPMSSTSRQLSLAFAFTTEILLSYVYVWHLVENQHGYSWTAQIWSGFLGM